MYISDFSLSYPFTVLASATSLILVGRKKTRKGLKFKKGLFKIKVQKNKYFHLNSMPLFQTSFSFTYLSNTGLTLNLHLNSGMFARNLKREKTFLYVF